MHDFWKYLFGFLGGAMAGYTIRWVVQVRSTRVSQRNIVAGRDVIGGSKHGHN